MNLGSPWDTSAAVPTVAGAEGGVSLVQGQTFCLSDGSGDMTPGLPQGLFVLDTRVISLWELRLNGQPLETLAVACEEAFSATFVGRGPPAEGAADAHLVSFRYRHIGRGMRERIRITNHGLERAGFSVELRCDVDFAHLFEVKESRLVARDRRVEAEGDASLRFRMAGHAGRDDSVVTVTASHPAQLSPGLFCWEGDLDGRCWWEACIEVSVARYEPRFRCSGVDTDSVPVQRMTSWRARLPQLSTDSQDLSIAVARSGEDLGALRIFDPEHPDAAILAAGAPWFMTVFGRDSLLTGWMTLPADAALARGVLETLARHQGQRVDAATEEEPGKILHEIRFRSLSDMALAGGQAYFGSVDATPLFVMLLAEVRRWGSDDELVDRLLPHADRALDWIERFGDRGGDGYVKYERQNPQGLANQGWKDSWDAIRFADGTVAEPPIALCEVQGYVYAAYVARAHFALEAGDEPAFRHYSSKATQLRRRFNQDFWLEDQGCFALGLDRTNRPIDAVASNMGHCLWTGIVEPDRASLVADRLMAPDMFSGWGIRTLASTMSAYNPVSYHNGSVWPHDNAICAAGLARYGFQDHAQRVISGQLEVSAKRGGRLPELFAGFDRHDVPVPAAYPASCSPQAWAAASPLLWLRTLLRLDPWVPGGKLWVAPQLPDWITSLGVAGMRLGDSTLSIRVHGDEVEVDLDGGLEVIRQPRHLLTEAGAARSDPGGPGRAPP
ncbi:MAG: amylo-alpha-1,6-glucosidase [Actinobacteria bacterium]|nr:amylo-alpha-1,6-glucosidase [Actinomycetota bacterium]